MHHVDSLCCTTIITPKRTNRTSNPIAWIRIGGRFHQRERSLSVESEIVPMVDDKARALIQEVLDEISNGKLEEMMTRGLRVVGKKPVE